MESPISTGCSPDFDTNLDETKYKQRLKMSKKLIGGGDFTFQMTEIINFCNCFCSFEKGPLQISSPELHDGYWC